jgi:threonine/homoserine/homoserine lactone efflux protein
MIPFEAELSIAGVVLLGAVSPGPDFFVLTRRTAVSGRRAGLTCAAGMATGIFAWVTAVGDGVSALLAASPVVFTIVKSAGGTYLVVLGLRAWLSACRGGAARTPETAAAPAPSPRSFREGLLCNLLNPKVAVFYLAFLPRFLPRGGGWSPTLELAVTAAATVMCWYVFVALIIVAVRRFLTTRVSRVIDAAVGTVLIGLGVLIATT